MGTEGTEGGAGPLPWCVPGAGGCCTRSSAPALGTTWPLIPRVCGVSPEEPGARLEPPHPAPVWTPGQAPASSSRSPCAPTAGLLSPPPPPGRARRGPARRGPAACVRPSAARPRLRRRAPPSSGPSRAAPGAALRGPEGGRRTELAPLPLPPLGEEQARTGPARQSCAGFSGRACGAGRRRGGGYRAAAEPLPCPSLSPPPDSRPGTRTSEARGGRTGRVGPGRRRSEHTHALTQAVRSMQAPRPAPSTATRALRAPPSSCPPSNSSCNPAAPDGEWRRPPRKRRRRRLASPLSGPSGSRGQRPELDAKKGKSRPAPAPRPRASFHGWDPGPLPPPRHKRRGSESLVRGGPALGARLGHSPGGCHALPPTIRCLGRLNEEPPPTFRWESAQVGGGGLQRASSPPWDPASPKSPFACGRQGCGLSRELKGLGGKEKKGASGEEPRSVSLRRRRDPLGAQSATSGQGAAQSAMRGHDARGAPGLSAAGGLPATKGRVDPGWVDSALPDQVGSGPRGGGPVSVPQLEE